MGYSTLDHLLSCVAPHYGRSEPSRHMLLRASSLARTEPARSAWNAAIRARSAGVGGRQDPHREQARVARAADRDRRHRHPGGHLHDRQQRVQAVEVLRAAPARRSPAAASAAATIPGRCAAPPAPGDDHLQPAVRGRRRRSRACAAACGARSRRRTSYAHLELGQRLGGGLHHRPVRVAAHDHADPRLTRHALLPRAPTTRPPTPLPRASARPAPPVAGPRPSPSPSAVTCPILRAGRSALP